MVSIIMPTYNRGYIIERAIKSVLRQTYQDWELIIVDDASTDNTKEVLQKYIDEKISYHVSVMNKGANAARNMGVAYAKGDVLAFLDSDNYWPDDKLEVQMEILEDKWDKRCFLYGKTQIRDGEDVRIIPEKLLSGTEIKEMEIHSNVIDLNTILIRKELFCEAGKLNEALPRLQDWELVLRLLFDFHVEAIGCERLLSFNEIQKNSIGKTMGFMEAYHFIVMNYLYKHLTDRELLQYFVKYWDEYSQERKKTQEIINEIAVRVPTLFQEAFQCILNDRTALEEKEKVALIREEKLKTSRGMENLLYEWHNKNAKYKGSSFFKKYFYEDSEFKNIAIYGLGKLGQLLYREIRTLPVNIVCGIDKEKKNVQGLPVFHSDNIPTDLDLIIIAVLKDSQEIKNSLSETFKGNVMTLSELVYNA